MNSCVVVKLGGSLLEDGAARRTALESVAEQWHAGVPVVLVHGGGKRVDQSLSRIGISKETVAGLRVTNRETLDVVVSVLAGLVNKQIVAELEALGVPAAGISGADGMTLQAEMHPPIDGNDLGFVGKVTRADATLIEAVTSRGFLPVVASVAYGQGGTLLNVNADSAASAIAVATGASRLLFLTDVPGLLDDRGQVIATIHSESVRKMLTYQIVRGGIVPKLQACLEALTGGVSEVRICGGGPFDALHMKGGTSLVAA